MKKTIAAALILLFMMPFTAEAHTALTESNPAQGEVLTEIPQKLELRFGTKIEEGSSLTLTGPSSEVELDTVSVEGDVMKGIIPDQLENGQYIISWKIIGEDGHPIEGEIAFSLNVASEESVEPSVETETVAEPPVTTSSEKQSAANEQPKDEGVMTVLLLIAITVLVGFGSVLLIKMKR